MSFKIDATNTQNLNDKVLTEKETRRKILSHARLVGMEKDMLKLFADSDRLLRQCTNDAERKDMRKLFVVKVYKLLGGGGQLFVDGELVCDERPSEERNGN